MASLKGFLDWVKGEDMEEITKSLFLDLSPQLRLLLLHLRRLHRRIRSLIPQIHSVQIIRWLTFTRLRSLRLSL